MIRKVELWPSHFMISVKGLMIYRDLLPGRWEVLEHVVEQPFYLFICHFELKFCRKFWPLVRRTSLFNLNQWAFVVLCSLMAQDWNYKFEAISYLYASMSICVSQRSLPVSMKYFCTSRGYFEISVFSLLK